MPRSRQPDGLRDNSRWSSLGCESRLPNLRIGNRGFFTGLNKVEERTGDSCRLGAESPGNYYGSAVLSADPGPLPTGEGSQTKQAYIATLQVCIATLQVCIATLQV